ncbi:MAG: SapC family protein [Burkholderiaceae bacterium]|jgi:hypothetical protein
MEITAPFGYQSVTPLLREMRVRPTLGAIPEFAKTQSSLPIAAAEAIVAGHDYPICFIVTNQTEYVPIVILGVERSENLFVTDGKWRAGCYVPAYLRRFPFCMTRVAINGAMQNQSIICVEQNALGDDGVPVLDADGKPTPDFAQVQELLGRFESELERTREMCKILADYRLFGPMSAKIEAGGATFELNGLIRIDETRMEHLTSNQLKTLVKKGAMALIYQHLASLVRFHRLTEIKALALQAAAPGAAANEAAPKPSA